MNTNGTKESAQKQILVTGATGTLGRSLVPILGQNYQLRLLSRKPRPDSLDSSLDWVKADLSSDTNISLALNDIDIIFHGATSPAGNSEAVDLEGTRKLVQEAQKNRISHFIYPSIIGIEDIPLAYYQHKKAAEEFITQSGIPYTILRTTQFHQLIDSGLTYFNKLPLIMLLPRHFRFQSIDPTEVARRFASIIGGGATNNIQTFAGPAIQTFGEMAGQWFEQRGEAVKKRINLPIPGQVSCAFREGRNTCAGCHTASTGWEEWLTLHYAKERRKNERPHQATR